MTKKDKATKMINTVCEDAKTTDFATTESTTPVTANEIIDIAALSKRLEKSTVQIRKEIGNVTKSFCRIGFELWNAKEYSLYLGQGFNSVTEYGEKVFGFKKSSVSNYISICERFSVRKNDKPTNQLLPEFANFSYGQLSLMMSMPDDKLSEISPDATCKEIREMKKADTSQDSDSDNEPADAPAPASAPAPNKPFKGMIFSKVLVKDDVAMVIKLLRENVGREIVITVEG